MKIETLAVHAGRRVDPATGAVAAPIVLSSTYERREGGEQGEYIYSRLGNANREALEVAMAALEAPGSAAGGVSRSGTASEAGGVQAAAFASGSAVTATLMQALSPGDHIVLPRECYYGTVKIFHELAKPWGLEATFVDTTDLGALSSAAANPRTRLVWIETPSNPRLRITDIAAAAGIAHGMRALLVVDNTFATPVLTRPLSFGADLIVHATSKGIGGHSDLVGGVLVAGASPEAREFFARVRTLQTVAGAIPGPFDCWLALRGIRTLPVRMRAQSASALKIARWLEASPAVSRVHYPGLPAHPGHDIAARQMDGGFGSVLSFRVGAGREAALQVASRTRLFIQATSLGGVESLIEHRATVEGALSASPDDLLRISVGLEAAEDLVADLADAMEPFSRSEATP